MKSKVSVFTLFFGFTTLVAGALAGLEYWQVRQMKAEGLTADERAQLQKAAWDARKEARRLQTQLAAAQALRTEEGDAKPGADNRSALGQMAADYISRLDDPEIRRLMDLRAKANIARQYGAFFRDAHLTPAQIQQFEQLMVERQMAETDVLVAAAQQGINPMSDPDGFRQMVRNAQSDVDSQIQGVLGTDDYAQLQTYQQTQSQRGVVNQLQQDLSFTDSPLSDQQKQQMMQVIAQTNPPGGTAINDQTIAQAQSVLSQPQVDALKNIQQLQQVNRQLGQLMRNSPSR